MFPSFVEHPENCRYEGQDDDENIILLLRAHPITNIGWILFAIILFFTPILLPGILTYFQLDLSFVPQSFSVVFAILDYLLTLVVVFEGFLGWYFNVSILTNKKIIDIDFYSILSKNIDHALLRDVQESNSKLAGIFGMFFNYGNVFVQTAASQESIDFINIPKPDLASDIIMDEALKVRGT